MFQPFQGARGLNKINFLSVSFLAFRISGGFMQPHKEKLLVSYKSNDVTSELRSEIIAKSASEHSSKKEVREALFNIQRNFYDGGGLVADGRDMGTVVFKDAKLKIFLTASPEERAKRRFIELQNLGQEVNMPALIADIEQRDKKDSSRKLSPLLPAEDAHIIDSSNMKLDEVFSLAEKLINNIYLENARRSTRNR